MMHLPAPTQAEFTRSAIDRIRERVRMNHATRARRAVEGYWGFFQRYLQHYCRLPSSAMHQDLMKTVVPRLVTQQGIRLVAEGPRGSAKSTHFAMGLPLYGAVTRTFPYILICADSSAQAEAHLRSIRTELEENIKLSTDFPEACWRGPVWNDSEIELRNGVRIEALGAGKRIRGRRHGTERPRLIIVDDPEDDEATFSRVKREHRRSWFTRGVVNAGDERTNIVVDGTRLHAECLTAHLATAAGWTHLQWRSVQRWPARMELWQAWELAYTDTRLTPEAREDAARAYYEAHRADMDDGAIVLWPALHSLYALMVLRASGHAAFEQEHQCNPIDPATCEWGPELFTDDLWFDEWPRDMMVRTVGVDPSKGKSDRAGDYSAIVKLGVSHDGTIYVEADLAHRGDQEIVDTAINAACTDLRFGRASALGFEEDAFQHLYQGIARRRAAEWGIVAPICGVRTEGVPKPVRIRRWGPHLHARSVRFKSRSPGTTLLVRQLQEFPNGDHDDGPDGAEMALRLAAQLTGDRAADEQAAASKGVPEEDLQPMLGESWSPDV